MLSYITPQPGGPLRRCGIWLTTLPILYNNALIGRIDPKAHRKDGIFEAKALHLEPGVTVDDALVAEVRSALRACARFAKQIVAQDTAGRRPVCGQTRPRQTDFGLIVARAVPFKEIDRSERDLEPNR